MQPNLITDMARLHRYIELDGTACRWTVVPRGVADPLVPGPTDTVLWASIDLAPKAWAALGAPVSPSESLRVPEAIAALIAPALPKDGADRIATGPSYPVAAQVRNPYAAETGVRVGDALVVALYSR
ncbi:MAG: hypothetical protein ABI321_15845 [Polyangia bacterium]